MTVPSGSKMEAYLNFFKAVFSLVTATFQAVWTILQQAGAFFESAFSGETGAWLLGGGVLLAVAGLFNYVQSRIEARHLRHARPRGLAYYGSFALIGLAFGILVYAEVAKGFSEPGQRPLFLILAIVSGLHLAWFTGDFLCHRLNWDKGGAFFRKIVLNRTAYYMVLPTFILIGTFLYIPAVSIFYYSFFAYDLGGTKEVIGLGNYVRLLGDEIFWKSAKNMALLTVASVSFTLAVPLIVAELVFHLRTERMRYYLRAAFLIPMVVPGVIIFLIWGYFYSDAGLIPLFGHAIGLGDKLEGLLSRPQTALWAVIFVGFPFVMGINLLIFYAGLSNVDEAVWEAAEMDGAKPLRRFFTIDLPLLLRQFKLLLILGIIGGVQAFENVLVMTQGGPGWQTMLPGLYMYRSAMSFNEYGFACAVGVTLFLTVLVLSLAVNRGFPTSKT